MGCGILTNVSAHKFMYSILKCFLGFVIYFTLHGQIAETHIFK